MIKMEQCWRWFGPDDPVSLQDARQAGATGIVTALHHIPHGAIWPAAEILERKKETEDAGLKWSVVESLPVHESIKTRTGNYKDYIENYKISIRNIAACGIPVITYNFMPVNDWTRTSLNYGLPNGAKALYFNWVDLAVFDIYILKRENAAATYTTDIQNEASKRFGNYSKDELDELAEVVMFGIPGEQRPTLAGLAENLRAYAGIDHGVLQNNLVYFLEQVSPVAAASGVKLAIHPDDPPFPIFGLPRVVSSMADIEHLLNKVDNAANGVCFCTGSLGANAKNDLPEMVRQIGNRIHFAHLRNVTKDAQGNFYEADHLGGDNDMYAVVKALALLQQQTKTAIPFRPDHGHQLLDDLQKKTNPGYSAIGRLKGLAEIRGLELAILRAMEEHL